MYIFSQRCIPPPLVINNLPYFSNYYYFAPFLFAIFTPSLPIFKISFSDISNWFCVLESSWYLFHLHLGMCVCMWLSYSSQYFFWNPLCVLTALLELLRVFNFFHFRLHIYVTNLKMTVQKVCHTFWVKCSLLLLNEVWKIVIN